MHLRCIYSSSLHGSFVCQDLRRLVSKLNFVTAKEMVLTLLVLMAKAYFLMIFYICKKMAEWTGSSVDERFLSELKEPKSQVQKDQESQTDISMSQGQISVAKSRSKTANNSPNSKQANKSTCVELFIPEGCPICKRKVVIRKAARGGRFWGCTGWEIDRCKGTWSLDGVPGPIKLVNEACYRRSLALTHEIMANQQTSQPESTASGQNDLF